MMVKLMVDNQAPPEAFTRLDIDPQPHAGGRKAEAAE